MLFCAGCLAQQPRYTPVELWHGAVIAARDTGVPCRVTLTISAENPADAIIRVVAMLQTENAQECLRWD